jgi:hypothetical protein
VRHRFERAHLGRRSAVKPYQNHLEVRSAERAEPPLAQAWVRPLEVVEASLDWV